MQIQVSVIVITFNHEKYISKALDSILSQKLNSNFEIIIGEDKSSDKTGNIVKKYKAKFPNIIRIVDAKENLGMLKNEREALKLARGKYIAFCEGDDYWNNKHKLQKQVDFLENNSDYGLVHSDVDHLYEYDNKHITNYNKSKGYKIPQGNIFYNLIDNKQNNGHLIKTMTVCLRKKLLDKYWDYDLPVEKKWQLTDLPLWLDISKNSKIHYISESLATYRLLPESASRSRDPEKLHAFHLSVYDVRRYYIKKYNLSNTIKDNVEISFNLMKLADSYGLRDSKMAKRAKSYLDEKKINLSIKQKIKYFVTRFFF